MSTTTNVINHGKSKYIQGDFHSKKNNSVFPYKSSYELAYLQQLESDDKVVQYIYEPFELYYKDIKNSQRIYRPDFMVLYSDGSIRITEVKPEIMLSDYDVRSKAKSARAFIKENYTDLDIKYEFITEKNLFNDAKEYQDFIKSIKG